MTTHEPVAIHLKVQPWFKDHCFAGKVILPAVETMSLLAQTVLNMSPHVNVQTMERANFLKFLEIPSDATWLDTLVELAESSDGGIFARLLTRKRLKAMTRLTAHCELSFVSREEVALLRRETTTTKTVLEVSAERIYRELVPFGPAYRTLNGRLCLGRDAAWGNLSLPSLESGTSPLGSPFSLDGAMHAACVHGQQHVDFVPFPVGFAKRSIVNPTRPGEEYLVFVHLRSLAANQLVYDLQILDQGKNLRENVLGLRMRDVTGGRIKPPDWIRRRQS